MLTIEVTNDTIRPYLERLQARAGDLSQPLASIGMELESRISGRFETESDPRGAAWHPWAASTRATYPAGANGRILDRYGDMLASLSHQVGKNEVRIGFGDPKAAYHEWGTKRMPRRGLLFDDPDAGTLAPDDEVAVLDVLSAYLLD